ncbi:2898_t:CDS:2 [Ambispora gerdemannii]|uniref:2898_t:CDS:1 n=1 Tax=Ambispora gerdemannii TaxID=144530 RepID=A0A9N8YXV1_9GLOM|nr:2898_t:CDS:2 [Ambispora gerdemannii]
MASAFDDNSDDIDDIEEVDLADLEFDCENYKEKNKNNYEDDESVTAFFTCNICITKIMYSLMPIEYPPTVPDGYAVIFNVDE